MESHFFKDSSVYAFSLLDSDTERRLSLLSERILEEWEALPKKIRQSKWIIIDEDQRLLKILDSVHLGIEKYGIRFAATANGKILNASKIGL